MKNLNDFMNAADFYDTVTELGSDVVNAFICFLRVYFPDMDSLDNDSFSLLWSICSTESALQLRETEVNYRPIPEVVLDDLKEVS